MTDKLVNFLNQAIAWLICLIVFFVAIAPAPVNVFIGLLIFCYLLKTFLSRENLFTGTALNLPLLIFFAITCISLFGTVSLKDSIRGGVLRLLQNILLFFVLVKEIRDVRQIKRIVFFIALGIILTFFDSIWQLATGRDFIRHYELVVNIGLRRVTAAFKDSNTLGIYLSAFSGIVFGAALFRERIRTGLFMSLVSLALLVCVLLTYSRPTLLAIYAVCLFLSIAGKRKALLVVLLILAVLSPFVMPHSVKEWAKTQGYNPLRLMCNDDRIAVYRNTLRMIQAHPVKGVGANTFMKNYAKYREKVEYRGVVTKDHMFAHNNFLHMAGEIGLIGLAVFIWLIIRLFRQIASICRRLQDKYLKGVLVSVSSCLMAFLLNGLTESSLYYSRVVFLFWLLAGFALAFENFIKHEAN